MASRTSLGTGEVRNFYFNAKEYNGHSWGPTQPAVLAQSRVHVQYRVVPELGHFDEHMLKISKRYLKQFLNNH